MARPGLLRHRKFARLARLLGSEPLALGHLEMLWGVAYENGDDYLGDAGDVEYLGKWSGESGKLAAAMVEAGFLDLSPDGYRVHDLWDHAPDYVRKRRSREQERQTKGAELKSLSGQCPTSDRSESKQRQPNGRTPAPAPAPAPKNPPTPLEANGANDGSPDATDGDAAKAWAVLAPRMRPGGPTGPLLDQVKPVFAGRDLVLFHPDPVAVKTLRGNWTEWLTENAAALLHRPGAVRFEVASNSGGT